MTQITLDIIGTVHSPYKEKFAVPRQPGLVSEAKGRIELIPPFGSDESVRDLEQFTHIWVLFVFHGTKEQGWKPLVRPPRLGGNTKTGVFATRSTFRPNPIGMSVVKLDGVTREGKKIYLDISGLDLLDQTPVIDIKPYVPYSDSHPQAGAGFANSRPENAMVVEFSDEAENRLATVQNRYPELKEFIVSVLSQDPRPAYKNRTQERQSYGVRLYDFNVVWEVEGHISRVLKIDDVSD